MIPEIGVFALVVALCLAAIQGTLPLAGTAVGYTNWVGLAKTSAYGQLFFVLIAYGSLTWSFLTYDFSVLYVAQNSNLALPLIYRISGVWGGHEGSLLLWMLILSSWTAVVSIFSYKVSNQMLVKVLAILGLISVGFLLLLLFTSNPFERQFPAPSDGHDLNPLLQDPGLAIHPPLLYIGYVGFSVPFAFAIAGLLNGQIDTAWARWSRMWASVAWVFLTIGITLGSWWAYNELGWGGWWFWDPVENASFMPWLVGTALIHSLAATEKRGVFKAWTVLLAIFTFSLSLLGTFLVRSGILTSVHAFATDPARGVFILSFLGIVIGGSLLLYAWKAPRIRSSIGFDWLSREIALLLNNVLLVVTAATILLGTLYPLILDSLGLGKISVGPPYFNAVFIPLAIPLALLAGVGAITRWKQDRLLRLVSELRTPFCISLALGLAWPFFGTSHYSLSAGLGGTLGLWAIVVALQGLWKRTSRKDRWRSFLSMPGSIFGQTLAHSGIGIFVIGIAFTSAYTIQKDLRMVPGEEYYVGDYAYKFEGVEHREGPNYRSEIGSIKVFRNSVQVAHLRPEKRFYSRQGSPMTEPGIDAGVFRDLYVALGEQLNDDGNWSVRVHYNAFIRWIWLGPLLMAFGGLISVLDPRYRRPRIRANSLTP